MRPLGANVPLLSKDAFVADEELLTRAAQGDDTALGTLYDNHGGVAYGLAYRMLDDVGLAKDLVQEAFLAVWKNAASFDVERGSARSWILTIVRHRAIDEIRRRHPTVVPNDIDDEGTDNAWTTLFTMLRREALARGLETLTPERREVLVLAYVGGLSQSEIAARLGIPLGTVKSKTRHALTELRRVLETTDANISGEE